MMSFNHFLTFLAAALVAVENKTSFLKAANKANQY